MRERRKIERVGTKLAGMEKTLLAAAADHVGAFHDSDLHCPASTKTIEPGNFYHILMPLTVTAQTKTLLQGTLMYYERSSFNCSCINQDLVFELGN